MLLLGQFLLFNVILRSISNRQMVGPGWSRFFFFFGFYGLICKYFGGEGPKYIFWGKFLFF